MIERMTESIDVYSETNPAFLSLALWSFLKGFQESDESGAELPMLYLPIPIILSGDFQSTFEKTNKRTGFLAWLNRNQGQLINFDNQLKNTRNYTQKSILFGLQNEIISVSSDGKFGAIDTGLSKKPKYIAKSYLGKVFTRSERFGFWLGDMRSTKAVYSSLRVVV